MLWDSLRAVRSQTSCEFTRELALLHHFVKLKSGRWTRTLGPPAASSVVHVRGRVWHMN